MTPKRKASGVRRPTKQTGADATAVLLEEVHGQMKVVIEALQECATKRDIEEVRGEMRVVIEALRDCATKRDVDARFDAVDARFDAVDARFDAVDARFASVDVRFDGVDQQLRELRHTATLHAQSSDLRALEQRVVVLERRAGI